MELDDSILLQKQVRDNSEDMRSEFLDMKNWEEQMKRKEQEILNERNGQQIIPPVRRKNKNKCAVKENKTSKNPKRIKSYDYTTWDKFNVDKACKELESEGQSDESAEEPLSKEELQENHNKATECKEQGNEFVKQKKWDKAIASYSEAIKLFPHDAIFYANRALCYLKQDNLYSAEADCSSAIQLDKTYLKAYHRRATARLGLKQCEAAMEDIKKIIDLEPCSKETKTLISQIKKQYGDSFMSKMNLFTTEVSDNKKINQKVINVKKNKNNKSSININNTVKPTSTTEASLAEPSITESCVTELRKNRHIPDWLPEKNDVAIVEPIDIPPHLRSKEPLKRIPVQETDLSKPFKKEIDAAGNKNKKLELIETHLDNIAKQKENIITCKPKENITESCTEMPPIPTNSVQFLINWKKDTSFDFRYRYLKQIPSSNLPKIFQDSMETDIFSGIITTLKTGFMRRNEPIFSYLKDLSNVKRFRAFIMFITNSEKQDLKLMFSYCSTSEKIPEKEIADLQNKYEI